MSHPCITVIIPVYNTAAYLRQCLGSVCGQSYPHLEIICVDDGSTDDSPAILAEYAARDSRIKLILQPNAGVSAARNAGLEAATGEYVTGLDSDDYLEPHAYAEIMGLLGSRAADIVCFGLVAEADGKTSCPAWACLPPDGYYRQGEIAAGAVNDAFWNKLWRREFLHSVGVRFPVGLRWEDTAFWYMAAPYAKDIYVCSRPFYHYVRREDSYTSNLDYATVSRNNTELARHIARFHQDKGGLRHVRDYFCCMLVKRYEEVLRLAPFWKRPAVRQVFRRLCREWGLDRDPEYRRCYPVADLVVPWRRWNPFLAAAVMAGLSACSGSRSSGAAASNTSPSTSCWASALPENIHPLANDWPL